MLLLVTAEISAYRHADAPSKVQKSLSPRRLSLMHGLVSSLRVLSGGLVVGLMITFWAIVINGEAPSGAWWYAAAIVVALLVARFILSWRYVKIAKVLENILKGQYRQYVVTSNDFSFQVVFDSELKAKMDDGSVKSAVDALFGTVVSMECDRTIASISPLEVHAENLGRRFEAKTQLIRMVDRLSSGLGVEQPEYFEKLRQGAYKELRDNVTHALGLVQRESKLLKELRQLR